MNFGNIVCFNRVFDKNEIRNLISWFLSNYGSIRTKELLDKMKNFGFTYATTTGLSLGLGDLKIPSSKANLVKSSEKILFKTRNRYKNGMINFINVLDEERDIWNVVNENLKKESINNLRQSDFLNPLYSMTLSGARGSITQVKQLIGMRGLMSDSQGNVIPFPIKTNFKEGLNITEYFVSCYGARKGLIDTALKTANAGYLTRRMIYTAQNLIVKRSDCFTKYNTCVLLQNQDKEELKFLKEKLIGRVLAKTIVNAKTGDILVSAGQDICNYTFKKIINFPEVYIRTPFNCVLMEGICQICYGWNLACGKMVELGECVGILAAQSIGEPGTQLTMRTFHTGGVFSAKAKEVITSPLNGKIWYDLNTGLRRVYNKFKEKAFLTLQEKKIVIYENDVSKSIMFLPSSTLLYVKPGRKIFDKQIIGESVNSNLKNDVFGIEEIRDVKAKISGQIFFPQINSKQFGKIFWIISSIIMSFTSLFFHLTKKFSFKNKLICPTTNVHKKELFVNRKKELFPRKFGKLFINIRNVNSLVDKSKVLKKRSSHIITCILDQDKVIMLRNLKKQKRIFGNFKIGCFLKTGQIISNFKLLHSSQIIQERKEFSIFRKVMPFSTNDDTLMRIEDKPFIRKNQLLYRVNFVREKTYDIVQGLPKVEKLLEARMTSSLKEIINNPHDILTESFFTFLDDYENLVAARKSFEVIQKYLIDGVQTVYKSQGVKIADKHIELIVKQITSKVIVTNPGDSSFMVGDFLDLNLVEVLNKRLVNSIVYEPIIMGLTRFSLSSQSFIAQASFQETTRVLTKAALQGRADWLSGLKENLVLGNIIPAGTGFKN